MPIVFVSYWSSKPVWAAVLLVGDPVFANVFVLAFVKDCHW